LIRNYRTTKNKEIHEFINIYVQNEHSSIQETNSYITNKNLWDNFKSIRAMNSYDSFRDYEAENQGVSQEAYSIISKLLDLHARKSSLMGQRIY